MPSKNSNVHVQEYVYDFSVSGGTNGSAIALDGLTNKEPIPVGAIIKDVNVWVETALTSGAAATISLGNGDSATGYLSAVAYTSFSANAVLGASGQASSLLWDDSNHNIEPFYVADADDGSIDFLINDADLTAGKLTVLVEYYFPS